MALDKSDRVETQVDHSVGNLYRRLDQARARREQILDTPEPANAGMAPSPMARPFPRLKPPRPNMPDNAATPGRFDWLGPVVLAGIIFAVLFAYAIGLIG
ncbi:MAG: hypothetical protein QNJ20_01905 [Paracoccaceae bacterium]|nr:hypothetical protein [Paracoccaceae bacterium]